MQAAVPGCFVKRWWGAWASKVSTGDFCARLCRAALFDPRAHATKEKPQKALRLLGFYISAGGGGLPRASKVSTGDFCARLCRAALFDPRAHATKEKPQKALRLLGFYISAGGGGRTHTVSPPTDFESVSSANSNTPAHMLLV